MVQKRVRLSWKEKDAVLHECRRRGITRGRKAITEVCNWAWHELRLYKPPSYRTVLNIIRHGEKIEMKAHSTHSYMKKDMVVRSMPIENILVEWVWKMSMMEVLISEDAIVDKASYVQEYFNAILPSSQQSFLTFSNGWLEKFKARMWRHIYLPKISPNFPSFSL